MRKFAARLVEWPALLWRSVDVDVRDAHIYGGIAAVAVGLWILSPAWSLIVVGAVLFAVGLFVRPPEPPARS